MDSLVLYTKADVLALVNERPGEEKLGQAVQITDSLEEINFSSASFVVLGIPEDIGVRANSGLSGTKSAFSVALQSLLNMQSNHFLKGNEILLLGYFDIEEPKDQSIASLREKTLLIDKLVEPVIEKIVIAGKIPIVIGGGHNNAAPIIAGTSKALRSAINVVNIDAHADLRQVAEGRHSGNGFSTALELQQLGQYRVFGLHQNYVHAHTQLQFEENYMLKACYFEEILQSDLSVFDHWLNFTSGLPEPCGLEIDLDSIQQVLSSAATPSGFALNDIRKIVLSATHYTYFHLAEGATHLANGETDLSTGKTIAYLVTDFIKALLPHIARQPSS